MLLPRHRSGVAQELGGLDGGGQGNLDGGEGDQPISDKEISHGDPIARVEEGFVEHLFDSGGDNQLQAGQTGFEGDVDRRSFRADAVFGGLGDRIGLRVDRAGGQIVIGTFLQSLIAVALAGAVGGAGGRTIVAGGQNLTVFDNDGSDREGQTGGAYRRELGDRHKVFIPGWARIEIGHGGFTRAVQGQF
jgi:hypothetical protein